MVVVDIDPDELRTLTGHDEKSDDELKDDLFALGLEFEGETDGGAFQLEFAPDRLDRLSVEGVARSLRYQYGDTRGIFVPDANDAEWTIEVDDSVPDYRPYVTGAVVRDVNLSEDALDSLIQLQEKLHATMGRKRAKGAIGIHDLTMLKGGALGPDAADDHNSVEYRGVSPDGDTFVALDSDRELTPDEVLTDHPTGETYADLVEGHDTYPAIYDDLGLFSFPPVINGRRTEVTTDSRDLFIELTGTDQWTIDKMCVILCYALSARGGQIESVDVEYPDRTLVRPDFETTEKHVTHDRIETLLGVDLSEDEVVDYMERAGLGVETEVWGDGVDYDVEVPPYRVDVLHAVDIVDDVGRAHGFNELVPRYPEVGTVGGRTSDSRHARAVRNTLAGLGFEGLLNFHMIAEDENYDRMGLDQDTDAVGGGRAATIAEPYSEDYEILRTWALPSLLMVLENNTHRAYPQDLGEVGFAAELDDAENTGVAERDTVAAVVARHDASYEDAKSRLQSLCRAFDASLETPPTTHPSFIDGRTAAIEIDGEQVGVIGELHPEVIVEHDLEVPVAGFELRRDALE
ncbi:phenylalanine--tRNA ligase subunit beta [Salarchaeum sp. JOR-1]|uniref:phenylalanine--tRNA ligase subunit beta n=1 Tax=Salarchaeum sp. JOR-1 TaxID=2599399 RepID=UPI0011986BA5|nr:phenylalanine--tRNA ligase subunit beta [Salarchaeum sp. JOR-1]QDX40081.1 phenylalanine--tRNA ligase subunit beta [Salarchaeum sp. JOR-1]